MKVEPFLAAFAPWNVPLIFNGHVDVPVTVSTVWFQQVNSAEQRTCPPVPVTS